MFHKYIGRGVILQDHGEEAGQEPDTKNIFIVVGVILVAIIVIAAIFFMLQNNGADSNPPAVKQPVDKKSVCGDGTCDKGENCADCAKDCACSSGEMCRESEKTCVRKEPVKPPVKPSNPVCGNSVCDSGENCFDCPTDCKCQSGEYCSTTEKICLKPTCGNSKCESLESPDNCCLDCLCMNPGEECNKDTKKCEPITLTISKDRARELVTKYYQDKGKTVVSMTLLPWMWDGTPVYRVDATISGEYLPGRVKVYENETIEEVMAY